MLPSLPLEKQGKIKGLTNDLLFTINEKNIIEEGFYEKTFNS